MGLESPESRPIVVLLAKDLIFETRIRATAASLGIDLKSGREAAQIQGLLGDGETAGLIVDLECGEEAVSVIATARRKNRTMPIVAFGSHVQSDMLARAAAAGAGEVLPRSRFSMQLPTLLQGMVSPSR